MLSLDTKGTEVKKDIDAALNKYLSGSLQFIGNSTKVEASQKASEYAEKQNLSEFTSNPKETKDAIVAKETELKKASKQYGLQEKMNYAFDARVFQERPLDELAQGLHVALFASAGMMTAAFSNSPEAATLFGVGGVLTAATLTTGRFLSAGETEKEKKSINEYAEIKHAQLALKQLKKKVMPSIKAAENKEKGIPSAKEMFAAGLGNPGGMITPLDFKKNQGR